MRVFVFLLFLCCTLLPSMAEEVPFNGVITDIAGAPIKGARIYVSDERVFARSDKRGRFGLTDVKSDDTLHIVYKKEVYLVPVSGRKSLRIRLGDRKQFEASYDQELVNLGYGFVKRRAHTGFSSGISGEQLVRSGRTNILDALQGLVPGLVITSGRSPGFGSTALIHGPSSINSSTEPLYVVDGVIVNSLDFINVYDVEHVEILKDASIYGSRGANGAILVTTKRGSSLK